VPGQVLRNKNIKVRFTIIQNATSGSEVLTITKNVNWNGNGHTWTKTAANETAIFTSGYTSCKFSMLNLNLVRQNGTNPSDILPVDTIPKTTKKTTKAPKEETL
jgi:hypothetical protein